MKKRNLIILCSLGTILVIVFLFFLMPSKKYSNEYFGISKYVSNHDQDQDGIDDQTDILNETKKYITSKPKYKSNYYATGYPDDGYSVNVLFIKNKKRKRVRFY